MGKLASHAPRRGGELDQLCMYVEYSPPGFLQGKVRIVAITVQNRTAVSRTTAVYTWYSCVFFLFRVQYSLHKIGNGDWGIIFLGVLG